MQSQPPSSNKRKEIVTGIRVDYLQAAVTALRAKAAQDEKTPSDYPGMPQIRKENSYDWEAASVIEAAITAAKILKIGRAHV